MKKPRTLGGEYAFKASRRCWTKSAHKTFENGAFLVPNSQFSISLSLPQCKGEMIINLQSSVTGANNVFFSKDFDTVRIYRKFCTKLLCQFFEKWTFLADLINLPLDKRFSPFLGSNVSVKSNFLESLIPSDRGKNSLQAGLVNFWIVNNFWSLVRARTVVSPLLCRSPYPRPKKLLLVDITVCYKRSGLKREEACDWYIYLDIG